MQGLRPFQPQQDENYGPIFHGKSHKENDLGDIAKKTPMVGRASARKALGNITNQRGKNREALSTVKPVGNSLKVLVDNVYGDTLRGEEDRAALLAAQEEPEKRAGMGLEEMQEEKERIVEAEIYENLKRMAAAGRNASRSHARPRFTTRQIDYLEREVVQAPPSPPFKFKLLTLDDEPFPGPPEDLLPQL